MSSNTLSLKNESLVYPSPIESQPPYTNVLLINREVQDYQQFIDSANSSTFPVVYSNRCSKSEMLEVLKKM
jgi:hypothetical protein